MSIKPRALFSLFLGAAVACSSSSSTDERLDPAHRAGCAPSIDNFTARKKLGVNVVSTT